MTNRPLFVTRQHGIIAPANRIAAAVLTRFEPPAHARVIQGFLVCESPAVQDMAIRALRDTEGARIKAG